MLLHERPQTGNTVFLNVGIPRTHRVASQASGGWLGVRDDVRDWFVRTAA